MLQFIFENILVVLRKRSQGVDCDYLREKRWKKDILWKKEEMVTTLAALTTVISKEITVMLAI